ncbi:hypothetical protein A2Z41_01790 [Microgenomates group bacterium RBG_19FT_COMBO_39_10]|nr:MAG: hypothetical protein A2Z41_01790 [Microgenomates group bacterium RBG_19FT_COMBO_39_10]
MKNWKKVKIKECREPLVNLERIKKLKIYLVFSPQYYQKGLSGSLKTFWVRKSLAELLFQASQLLPQNYRFKIWDAWRPLKVQQALFEEWVKILRKENPNWSEVKSEKEAQQYVSLPSKDRTKPSPHNTGGAIDLTLVDSKGKELKMGTEFDYFGPQASTRYYEKKLLKKFLLPKEKEICQNRRLLYSMMIRIGFTNYPEEWWHYDYGNQFWGKIKKETAIYSKITPGKSY